MHRRLNVTDKLGSWQADNPVEPLFPTVRRQPRFELRESRAQPFERRRRPVLVLVDRRVAQDREHLLRMRRVLRLEGEVACLDDAHVRCSRCTPTERKLWTNPLGLPGNWCGDFTGPISATCQVEAFGIRI